MQVQLCVFIFCVKRTLCNYNDIFYFCFSNAIYTRRRNASLVKIIMTIMPLKQKETLVFY
uniref:Uncharacterized protein n=1 Tax=Musa acuminata subsp. malaccensis TaxID=214687 RepID=A0A804JBD0_MUSAM